MINIQDITKKYRTTDVETKALSNLSISVEEGEFVSIMGSSGCGKSTLLNIIGMLDQPNSGEYFFDEINVSQLSEAERTNLRKNNIGFIFQNFNLIDELSVFDNVALPLQYLNVSKSERKERVNEVLEKIGIGHRANHYPSQLSGGQQQRVAVSRAVVTKPKLILADEPTGNLDSHFGKEVLNILCDLNESGTTIIMVTHSLADAKYSKRIIELHDGKVLSSNEIQPNNL